LENFMALFLRTKSWKEFNLNSNQLAVSDFVTTTEANKTDKNKRWKSFLSKCVANR
jgi:hypothetical protein